MQFEERLNLVARKRNEETNADLKKTVVPTYGDGALLYFYVILICTNCTSPDGWDVGMES